ncbi:unnamed protein product [Cuscuta europaea]|uniref:Uncharacterized protein n=1 Tax=Cuscuta europaea TaxID=41803 RepID=A0A9P0Z8V5_CUSEU|nr:unnamed protein product [Cuscuta europaea]
MKIAQLTHHTSATIFSINHWLPATLLPSKQLHPTVPVVLQKPGLHSRGCPMSCGKNGFNHRDRLHRLLIPRQKGTSARSARKRPLHSKSRSYRSTIEIAINFISM